MENKMTGAIIRECACIKYDVVMYVTIKAMNAAPYSLISYPTAKCYAHTVGCLLHSESKQIYVYSTTQNKGRNQY